MAEAIQNAGTGEAKREYQEITLKFAKGLVGKEFQGKDGNSYKEIKIPNVDQNDKRPWQSFVVKANRVHEDQYGKGMWLKLPAEGSTTLQRSVVVGETPEGKKEWETEKTTVTNAELKKLVEASKERPRENVAENAADAQAPVTGAEEVKKEFKEITLKFAKGLAGKEFQGKDGNSYKEIKIPNMDQNDKRPWQSFVVKANRVHEDQFGKGMWLKLPSEGSTTLQRSVVVGETPEGKKEWGTEKTTVTNAELKKLVEAYKERPRESITEKLAEKKAEVTNQVANAEPREKDRSRENVLG